MSPTLLIICFILAIIAMIFMISKLKVHPFLALMSISLLLALVSGIPVSKIPSMTGDGFSAIFKSIGIVIIFGALIGSILEKTGAALKLADIVVGLVGKKFPELAMLIMGWIVGIPVFCDSGFVVLNPIRNALKNKIAANPVGMSVALSGGLYAAHVFIPPTPGPIAAAGHLGVASNLFLVIVMGAIVSVPVLIAVYFFAKYIGPKVDIDTTADNSIIQKSYNDLIKEYGVLPSGFLSLAPIFVPIFLMGIASAINMANLQDSSYGSILVFLGNPIIALAVGVIFAIILLIETGKIKIFNSITEETLKVVGPILFITAAGGVLGKVITEAGFVGFIKENAEVIKTAGIFFPFIIAAVLKTAQGSSTVAIITTASIMGAYTAGDGSLMHTLGLDSQMGAVLAVMAIGAGAMTVSHANDSYFWVVTNFSKMTPQQGYKTQSMLTFIMGIVGILSVYACAVVLL